MRVCVCACVRVCVCVRVCEIPPSVGVGVHARRYKLAGCTTRLNWLVILLMVVCVAPFAYFVPQLSLLHDFTLVAPRGSNSSIAYDVRCAFLCVCAAHAMDWSRVTRAVAL